MNVLSGHFVFGTHAVELENLRKVKRLTLSLNLLKIAVTTENAMYQKIGIERLARTSKGLLHQAWSCLTTD